MSSSNTAPADDKVAAAHKTLFDEGIKLRTQVNGAEYVEKALKNGSEFARPMQELVTEACWGSVWTRPGLEKKWRSLINVAMLVALNRSTELATHIKGAITNGATEVRRIQSAFLALLSTIPHTLSGLRLSWAYHIYRLKTPARIVFVGSLAFSGLFAMTSRADSKCPSGRGQGSASTSFDLLWNASGA